MKPGPVVFGLALIVLCVMLWRARKVHLTEKALVYATLFNKRTIPYAKIETVDLGRSLAGTVVGISGTGTTKTVIAPHKRADELHDRLCAAVNR